MKIKIADRLIGLDQPPFIIAEMSGNHNQDLDCALAIVDAAADAGVDAVKLQTYLPDTITLNVKKEGYLVKHPDSLWKGDYLYDLYKKAYTPYEWHKQIFKHCHKRGLLAFSTPFDHAAIDFLDSLDVPCYKVASFENNWPNFLKHIAKTGKPVIISTGMATVAEIAEAVKILGTKKTIILKCTSSYPATPANANLATLPHMRDLFGCEVGLSDHTPGIGVSVAAVAYGAVAIEKHFTLDRGEGGVDSAFSMEPAEMKALVVATKQAWEAKGKVFYGTEEEAKKELRFKRSLIVSQDIKKGDQLTPQNITVKRPNIGLHPHYEDLVLGSVAAHNATTGDPVTWKLIGINKSDRV